ncbi:MAG: TIGR01212 family radical SAM protein [Ruminococcaceae bacterium]|nr:TIGR01212 family radical SAM protein [Oscillospiraceae bacterium]
MKKRTQRTENPFKYTDTNKRYYTYDYYLRRTFGGKCAKIPIDAGFSCPNIDGRCGVGGCIYCSGRGSGDFAESPNMPVAEQYNTTRQRLSSKWSTERCIPYFQAHTNTYAPVEVLREKYEAVVGLEGVVALNIATRADCLGEDVTEYLCELAERVPLTVELGLQTSNDGTAAIINRGHTFADFKDGFFRLRSASEKIGICVHLIFGLPGEDRETMLKTVRDVAALHPDGVKIHLLHVIKGTKMAELYGSGEYTPLEKAEYVELVADALELLPPDVVVARVTGDGMAESLVAPEWSRKKVSVINDIDKLLFERDSYQGKRFEVSTD